MRKAIIKLRAPLLSTMQHRLAVDQQLCSEQLVTLRGQPVEPQTLKVMRVGLPTYLKYGEPWKHAQGWSTLKDSLSAYYALDPGGFYMLHKEGVADPIASLSAVRNIGKKIAYMGFYITRDEYRGKGYGQYLFDTVQKILLSEGYSLGLNCFETMTSMYNKTKFKKVSVDSIYSAEQSPEALPKDPRVLVSKFSELDENCYEALLEYDAKIYGSRRQDFLTLLLGKEDVECVIAFDSNQQIVGYAMSHHRVLPPAKDGIPGSRIGPLYADDDIVADYLLNEITRVSQKPVFLDTQMDQKPEVEAILKRGLFSKVVSLDRCYKGVVPDQDPRVVANTSLAFSHV